MQRIATPMAGGMVPRTVLTPYRDPRRLRLGEGVGPAGYRHVGMAGHRRRNVARRALRQGRPLGISGFVRRVGGKLSVP